MQPWLVVLFLNLGVRLFPLPILAQAQAVCVVKGADYPEFNAAVGSFWEALEAEGRGGPAPEYLLQRHNQEEVLSALQSKNPQLIFTVGNYATRMVRERLGDVPIVFSLVSDPVRSRILADLALPDPHVSGVTADVPLKARLEILSRIFPNLRKVGTIYSPASVDPVQELQVALEERGIDLEAQIVRETDDVTRLVSGMNDVDLFWMLPDRIAFAPQNRRRIFALLRREEIPILAPTPKFLQGKDGADVAISIDPGASGRQAAAIALQFLSASRWPVLSQPPREWIVFLKEGRGLQTPSQTIYVE